MAAVQPDETCSLSDTPGSSHNELTCSDVLMCIDAFSQQRGSRSHHIRHITTLSCLAAAVRKAAVCWHTHTHTHIAQTATSCLFNVFIPHLCPLAPRALPLFTVLTQTKYVSHPGWIQCFYLFKVSTLYCYRTGRWRWALFSATHEHTSHCVIIYQTSNH